MVVKNIPNWVNRLTAEYNRANTIKKQGLKTHPSFQLHEIAVGLFKTINENKFEDISRNNKEYSKKEIVRQVNILANKQLYHYKNCKFCFIEQFFSSLRNLFTFGSFHSSAYLAKKMTDPLLKEFKQKEKKQNPIVPNALINKVKEIIPDLPILSKKEIQKEEIIKAEIIREEIIEEIDEEEIDEEIIKEIEPQIVMNNEVDQPAELPLKEKLIQDLQNVWLSIDLGWTFIEEMWVGLFQNAEIKNWEIDKENPSKFTINLSKSLKGKYNLFTFIIKETIKFTLQEEGNKKIIEFDADKKTGLIGPLKTKLNKIIIQDTPKENPDGCLSTFVFTGFFYNGEQTIPATEALDYLNSLVWE